MCPTDTEAEVQAVSQASNASHMDIWSAGTIDHCSSECRATSDLLSGPVVTTGTLVGDFPLPTHHHTYDDENYSNNKYGRDDADKD